MRIREMREASGITNAELARSCRVRPVSVCQWESGEANPLASKLPMIAAVLGCEIRDLYEPDELRAASEAAAARVREKAAADAKALSEEGTE